MLVLFFFGCAMLLPRNKAQNLTLDLWEMLRKTNQWRALLTLANEVLPNVQESRGAPLTKVSALGSQRLRALCEDVSYRT